MEKSFKIYGGETEVKYQVSEANSAEVIEAIINWCEKYNAWGGEGIYGNDDCLIEAPSLISHIVDDILKFETVNSEDDF